MRRCPHDSADHPVQLYWDWPAVHDLASSPMPSERVLCDANREPSQLDSDVASKAEVRRMQTSVAIDEENVRRYVEFRQDFSDGREFAKREIGRDVREVHFELDRCGRDRVQARRITDGRRGERSIPLVSDVDGTDRLELLCLVLLNDLGFESQLFVAKGTEKPHLRQRRHEEVGKNSAALHRDLLSSQSNGGPLADRSAVRSHNPMRSLNRMIPNPAGYRDGGPDIAERPRHDTTRGHPAGWDLLEGMGNRLLEPAIHDGGNAPRAESLPAGEELEPNLVPHDSVMLSESGLFVHSPGGGIEIVRNHVHHGMTRLARLPDGRSYEPRSDSSIVVIGTDVELVELRPLLDPGVEPGGLECGAPHYEADHLTAGLGHGQPAVRIVHYVVDEEHGVDAADVRGVVDPERPKLRPGGFPMRHVAFVPPPLSAKGTIGMKDFAARPRRSSSRDPMSP